MEVAPNLLIFSLGVGSEMRALALDRGEAVVGKLRKDVFDVCGY